MSERVYIYYPDKYYRDDTIIVNQPIEHVEPEHVEPEHIEPKNYPIQQNTTNINSESFEMGILFLNIMAHIMFILLLMECLKKIYLRCFRNDRNNIIIRRRLITNNNNNNTYNYYHHKIIVKENFENDICSICLEDLLKQEDDTEEIEEIEDIESNNDIDEIIGLRCNHMFHKKCVEPWILNNKNCPLCKRDV